MIKTFAGTVLNVLWPMHIDVCRQELMVALAGQARPDLVGQTAGGQWVAIEAKGRSNAFAGGAALHDLGRLAQTPASKGLSSWASGPRKLTKNYHGQTER
jgi:hypothetical protein